MGEAKRRKQLGLMPTVYPFKVRLERDGTLHWDVAPPADVQPKLAKFFHESFPTGEGWNSEYRTLAVLNDRSGKIYRTQADLETIAVPAWRSFEGEVAMGSSGHGPADFPTEGGSVRLRERSASFDGQEWFALPAPRDPQHVLQALQAHPAFKLQGDVLGSYEANHWLEGRIDLTPDLPEDSPEGLLDYLEDLVREWHGSDAQEWAKLHAETLEAFEAEDALDAPPAARRLVFEVRRAAPLQNLAPPIGIYGDLEIHMLDGMAYSPDGDVWHLYADPEQTFENALAPELIDFFDLNTLTVTVYADGRIEWDKDEDISEEEGERIRRDLLETTGAGNPDEWKVWARQLLTETFDGELDIPAGTDFPVPAGFRLDVPLDVLGDESPLSQTYMESEVTFDGEHWLDLFEEEVPAELQPFATGQTSN